MLYSSSDFIRSYPKLSVAKIAFEGFERKAVPQGRPFAVIDKVAQKENGHFQGLNVPDSTSRKIVLDPIMGSGYNSTMRIISRKILREFWDKHPDARQPLQAWYDDVKHAEWHSPADIKNVYRNASFLANNRVVFNIKGNSYRLIVAVQYAHGILYIRFVGTHRDYDKIDAATI